MGKGRGEKKEKEAHVKGGISNIRKWLMGEKRGELQELRKHSLQTLLLLLPPMSSVRADVPKELFCHDSPVRVALSTPAGT